MLKLVSPNKARFLNDIIKVCKIRSICRSHKDEYSEAVTNKTGKRFSQGMMSYPKHFIQETNSSLVRLTFINLSIAMKGLKKNMRLT